MDQRKRDIHLLIGRSMNNFFITELIKFDLYLNVYHIYKYGRT